MGRRVNKSQYQVTMSQSYGSSHDVGHVREKWSLGWGSHGLSHDMQSCEREVVKKRKRKR